MLRFASNGSYGECCGAALRRLEGRLRLHVRPIPGHGVVPWHYRKGQQFPQGCDLSQIGPFPGKAVAGPVVNSRIQRRNTLSATSRSRAACATATPRSVNSLTALILNSRLNLRLVIATLQFLGHGLIVVSTKPAAGHDAVVAASGDGWLPARLSGNGFSARCGS